MKNEFQLLILIMFQHIFRYGVKKDNLTVRNMINLFSCVTVNFKVNSVESFR